MIVPLTPLEFHQRAATLFGDKVGVIDGDKRFTYAQFYERACRLANGLRNLAAPGNVVVMLCQNSHHVIEAYYGVVQAGLIFNPVAPHFDDEAISQVLVQTSSPVVICHADKLPLIDELREGMPWLEHIIAVESEDVPDWTTDYEEFLSRSSETPGPDLDAVDENAIAQIFVRYGGSGGSVMLPQLSHRTLYLHALSAAVAGRFSDEDTILSIVPMTDINGAGIPHYIPAVGGCMVLNRGGGLDVVMGVMAREHVTRAYVTPGMLNAMVRHADLASYDLSTLVEILVIGAASTPELVAQGEELLKCKVQGSYGQLEASPTVCLTGVRTSPKADPEKYRYLQSSGGLPLLGIRLRVVDDDGKDVPRDGKTVGKIILRSNTIMTGYRNLPIENEAKFKGGWYDTGDRGTLDAEGYLTVF